MSSFKNELKKKGFSMTYTIKEVVRRAVKETKIKDKK
jgi:hypothetical protein